MSYTAYKTSVGRIAHLYKAEIMCQQRLMLFIVGYLFVIHYAQKYLWLLLEGNYSSWSQEQTFDGISTVFSGVMIAILMGYWHINKRFHGLEPMPFSLVPARLMEKCVALALVVLSYVVIGVLSSFLIFLLMWLQFPQVHLSDLWMGDVVNLVSEISDWKFSGWLFTFGMLATILYNLLILWSVIRVRSYLLGLMAASLLMFGIHYLFFASLIHIDVTSDINEDETVLLLITLYELVCCTLVTRQIYRIISTTSS